MLLSRGKRGRFMRIDTSVCPYDCPDACGLLVEHDGKTVYKVKGNPNHTFTRGTLCPKMVHYEDTVHNEKRLLRPLRRIGKKGEGKFIPISWSEALEEIAQRFAYCASHFGGESIMPYSYAGTMGIIQKSAGDPLFAILGATQQDRGICSPAKRHGWVSMMGSTLGSKTQDMEYSDLVVLWSLNAVATDIHVLHDVKKARQNGAKVWVIDIYDNETCRQADDVILLRPGTDAIFALAVARYLEEQNLVNREFLRDYVEGYDEFVTTVLKDELYSLEVASEKTGVPKERIISFANDYGNSKKGPFIRLGSGLSRYGNGAMTVRCVCVLPAIVGAYARPGGGLLSSAGGSTFVGGKVLDWSNFAAQETRLNPMIKLGDMLVNATNPPIKCLYIYSSNPAITSPNQNLVRQGLSREDLFTVVHERFMTDTAKYADIVLPATTSLEHDDIYNSYGHYTIGCGYKLIDPIGESKSNWDTICLLAKTMCIAHPIFNKSAKELIYDILVESTKLSDEEKKQILLGEPVEMSLSPDYKMHFGTPSKKIMLKNPGESHLFPRYTEPHGGDEEFYLINGPDPRILDSSFCERDWKGDTMTVWIHPMDAERLELSEGDVAILSNRFGSLEMPVRIKPQVLQGTVVSLGVWWQEHSIDNRGTLNVLMPDAPTDEAWGSTFYDVKVNITKKYI